MSRLCFYPKEYAKPIDSEFLDLLKTRYDLSNAIDALHMEFIVANPQIPYEWNLIVNVINLEFLHANIEKITNWGHLIANEHFTMEYVMNNLAAQYTIYIIAYCSRSIEFIEANYGENYDATYIIDINFHKMPAEIIVKHPEWPWNYACLSREFTDLNFIDANNVPGEEFNWSDTIYNLFTDELFVTRPNESYEWYCIDNNNNLSEKFVRVNDDKPWSYYYMNRKRNNIDGIVNNDTDLYNIESNPKVSLECIIANTYLWRWKTVSANPNLTTRFIELNTDKINFSVLTHNRLYVYRC